MDGNRTDVVFSGDLTDPWVRDIRAAIPCPTAATDGPELPDRWPGDAPPAAVVLHRGTLGVAEADRLRRLREAGRAPRVVLVVGPHARYHQIMAWSGLVDVVLPDATARETIPRHVRPDGRPLASTSRRRTPIAVASGQFELGRMIEQTLAEAGFAPRRNRDDPLAGAEPWVVWDVPVLEPDWPDRLALASQRRGVVALLGLADRGMVAAARSSGAVACLDLSCDPDDLVDVLDRLTAASPAAPRRRRDPAHPRRAPRSAPSRAPADANPR